IERSGCIQWELRCTTSALKNALRALLAAMRTDISGQTSARVLRNVMQPGCHITAASASSTPGSRWLASNVQLHAHHGP
ncbi:hypothetical protein, partial [Xanthomonas perforans]|uniref:hypothetical protein n=1 Tax=Xanthomonas perforans TaxID=442694 RepID=UPI001F2E9F3C